jgi:hypothetical protein
MLIVLAILLTFIPVAILTAHLAFDYGPPWACTGMTDVPPRRPQDRHRHRTTLGRVPFRRPEPAMCTGIDFK